MIDLQYQKCFSSNNIFQTSYLAEILHTYDVAKSECNEQF